MTFMTKKTLVIYSIVIIFISLMSIDKTLFRVLVTLGLFWLVYLYGYSLEEKKEVTK